MAMTRIEQLRLLILGDKADTSADDVLQLLIGRSDNRLKAIYRNQQALMGADPIRELPDSLLWVSDEIVIRRFNRIGSEGFASQDVEGHAIHFTADDFGEFMPDILAAIDEDALIMSRKGRVVIY